MQIADPRNKNILIYINGKLYPREEAKISVFDSVVQGGDAVWEGLRVYDKRVFYLDRHLNRLINSAHIMGFKNIPDVDSIKDALFSTLDANEMFDETHVRLTLTRGKKTTSGMDPKLNIFGCSLIIIAEWKKPIFPEAGIKLVTASIRRNNPQFVDSKIHHNNLINNILAKMEANYADADEAIMLDSNGFVSETNACNIFMVKNGEIHTPLPDACLPGITRGLIIEIAKELNFPMIERNISVSEFYVADEVFTTGTMGELTPVYEMDGRKIKNGGKGSVSQKMMHTFRKRTLELGEDIIVD